MNVKATLLVGLMVIGCKGKEEGGASKSGKSAAPAPSAPATWKKIASMGIEVEVPGDADVQDNTATAGFPSATIYFPDGSPTTFIQGAQNLEDSMFLKADLEGAKKDAARSMDGFKAFSKEEKTADGWHLEYSGDSDSVTGEKRTLYGITRRSQVAGLHLDCSTNADSEAGRAHTLKVCTSIRAAK